MRVFSNHSIDSLRELLNSPKKITVLSHKNPDGDALGSSLAWTRMLMKFGHEVDYISPNDMPEFFKWLPSSSQMVVFDKNKEYAKTILRQCELIFCLDFNALSRVDEIGEITSQLEVPKILVDHHPQPESFAAIEFHDVTSSSTGELIFNLIEDLGWKKDMDKPIAELLYTAILTDTGSFSFACTTSRVHQIISELITLGANPNQLHNNVYNCFSENRLRFYGYSIFEKLHIIEGKPIAYFAISLDELRKFSIKEGETEGLVNYALKIEGIEAVGFFKESDKNVRISFRSKGDFDVNELSRKHFNGGGHKNAAGGISFESLEKTVEKFKNLFL